MRLDAPHLGVPFKVSDISHLLPASSTFRCPRDAICHVSSHQSPLSPLLLTWIIFSRYKVMPWLYESRSLFTQYPLMFFEISFFFFSRGSGYHLLTVVRTSLGLLFSTSNDYRQLQPATTYVNLLSIASFVM